jgi:hypothetical protein
VCKVRGILRRWVKALYGRVLYRGLLARDEIRRKAAAAAVLQGQWRWGSLICGAKHRAKVNDQCRIL